MKFSTLLSLLVLSSSSYAQMSNSFRTDIVDYKTYYNEITHDLSRSYDFECVTVSTLDMFNNKLTKSTSTTSGILSQRITNNGMTVISNSLTNYVHGDEIRTTSFQTLSNRAFIDDNTLETTSQSQHIRSVLDENMLVNSETVSKREMVDGEIAVLETFRDGEKLNATVEFTTSSFDPFNTKYVTRNTTTHLDVESGVKKSETICNYTQQGLASYKDYIPVVIVGEWKITDAFSGELSGQSFKFSSGSVIQNSSANSTNLGEYNIKSDKIEFAGTKYQMSFSSLNTVVFKSLNDKSLITLKRDKNYLPR
jgi:hypothetical protein